MERLLEEATNIEQLEINQRFDELVDQLEGAISSNQELEIASEPIRKPGGNMDQGWRFN